MPTTAEGEISRARFAAVPLILILLGFAAHLAHLAFLSALATGALNWAFNDATHRFGPGCDFFSIYAAGVKARLGESVFTIGGHVEQVPYAYAFRYAPVVTYTLGLVLSWLPALTAYGVLAVQSVKYSPTRTLSRRCDCCSRRTIRSSTSGSSPSSPPASSFGPTSLGPVRQPLTDHPTHAGVTSLDPPQCC